MFYGIFMTVPWICFTFDLNRRNVDYKYAISRRLLCSCLGSFSFREIWTKLKDQDQEIKWTFGKAGLRPLNPSLKYLKLDNYCFHMSHSFVWLFTAAPNPCAKELFPLSLKEIYEMFSSNNHFSLQCTARDKGFYFIQAKRTSERAAGQ